MNSIADSTSDGGPKLPLWDTIVLSYSTYFHFLADALRASWLWLVICAVATGFATSAQWTFMSGVMGKMNQGMRPDEFQRVQMPFDTHLLGAASLVVFTLAGVSIAVAWHRRLILGEPPAFSAVNIFTRHVWRYVGIGFVIGIIAFFPSFLAMLLTGVFAVIFVPAGSAAGMNISGLVVLMAVFSAYVIGILILLRLSMVLPARAVGDISLTFKQAWRRTKGNTWRILWGGVACMLLPIAAAQIIDLALFGFPDPRMSADDGFVGRMVLTTVLLQVYSLLVMPISVGFLSLSYYHFFGGYGAAGTRSPH